MSLATIKTKANTKLAAFADAVQIRQTSYANKNGKCFQLLVTDPVIVGVDTTWVLRTKEGQKNVDDIQFEFNSPVPFQVRVDEWVKKDSYGYSITVVVEFLLMFNTHRNVCVLLL